MSKKVKLSIDIQPLGDRVLVHPLEAATTTASGLFIPDSNAGEKPQQGTVIGLGNGGTGDDVPNPHDFLKVGDTVLFGRYAGDELKVEDVDGNDVELKVFRLDSVLGVVK